MLIPTAPNATLLFLLGGVFVHIMIAGGRTFYFEDGEKEPGALIGQLSFIVTGTMVAWGVGIRQPIPAANQMAAALVLTASLSLYEWARHTIWGRRLGLGWGEHVPEALCEDGPYRYIRHPIYLSYGIAFLAVLIALPHWITALSLLINRALFVDCARRDERVLAGSALATEYAAYRARTGMFLPRFSRAAPGR